MMYYDDDPYIKIEYGRIVSITNATEYQKKEKIKKAAKIIGILTAAGVALGAEFALIHNLIDKKNDDQLKIESSIDEEDTNKNTEIEEEGKNFYGK